jgi:hypothetical protein
MVFSKILLGFVPELIKRRVQSPRYWAKRDASAFRLIVLRKCLVLCLLLLNGGAVHRAGYGAQTTDLEQLIAEVDAARMIFDKFYFEYYLVTQYDQAAIDNGWNNANMSESRKIARDGEKRFGYKKMVSMPDVKIKYSPIEVTAVFDGDSCHIRRGKQRLSQKIKSTSCEHNYVFYALGWPEGSELRPDGRVFVLEALSNPKGSWTMEDDVLNARECLLASSTEFGMQFWFDKKSKMPVQYIFQRSAFCAFNKVVEFLNYVELNSSGVEFPSKIIVSSELFSREGERHGNAKVTIDIFNCSLTPSPDLFVLNPKHGELLMDLEKNTAFIYHPNTEEYFQTNLNEAVAQTKPKSFAKEFSLAWVGLIVSAVIVFLFLTLIQRARMRGQRESHES